MRGGGNAILIEMDGRVSTIYPRPGHVSLTLDQLQDLVGGNIEAITGWEDGTMMFGFDEAKLAEMEPNLVATAVSGLYPHDIVCGDVVIVPPESMEDDSTTDFVVLLETVADALIQCGKRDLAKKLKAFIAGREEVA